MNYLLSLRACTFGHGPVCEDKCASWTTLTRCEITYVQSPKATCVGNVVVFSFRHRAQPLPATSRVTTVEKKKKELSKIEIPVGMLFLIELILSCKKYN